MASTKPVCFVDETSFNVRTWHFRTSVGTLLTWHYIQARQGKMRTWMKGNQTINMPQFRTTSSVTIFVAISNVLKGPLFQISDTTNSANFVDFLQLIQLYRTDYPDQSPMFTVLDGHSAHHSHVNGVRTLLRGPAYKPFFLPRGTSWFNS